MLEVLTFDLLGNPIQGNRKAIEEVNTLFYIL
jgi:hypothetical protein